MIAHLPHDRVVGELVAVEVGIDRLLDSLGKTAEFIRRRSRGKTDEPQHKQHRTTRQPMNHEQAPYDDGDGPELAVFSRHPLDAALAATSIPHRKARRSKT